MKYFFQFNTLFFALFISLFISCNDNSLNINVDQIKVELNVMRFDQDLFENKLNTYQEFKNKYGVFLTDYTMGIMGFEGNEQEAFNQLMMFKNDPNAKKVYQFTKEKYNDFSVYENELKKAYQHFKYYYPEEKIPKIITYTSNFSFYLNPVGDNYIGMGLDMHLGEDFAPYKYTEIENYWHKILVPQTITLHHVLAHANDKFYSFNLNKSFLDRAIYEGKLLYFIDATMPHLKDEVKIGQTITEFNWCLKEEKNIWAYFVKKKLLYEADSRKYERFFKEGPKTVAEDVPADSPPLLGKYIGWQIVKKYMKENSDVTLQDMMKNTNAQEILQKSNYKP